MYNVSKEGSQYISATEIPPSDKGYLNGLLARLDRHLRYQQELQYKIDFKISKIKASTHPDIREDAKEESGEQLDFVENLDRLIRILDKNNCHLDVINARLEEII